MTTTQIPAADVEAEPTYRTADLVAAGVATYRQLDHWLRRGYLRLHASPGGSHPGQGRIRTWPITEVKVAARIGRLLAVGFELEQAARIARAISDLQGDYGWVTAATLSLAEGLHLKIEDLALPLPERTPHDDPPDLADQ